MMQICPRNRSLLCSSGGFNSSFTTRIGKSKVIGSSKVKPVFEFYNAKGIVIEGFEDHPRKISTQVKTRA